MATKTFKTKTKKNQADRLSAAVCSVLDGRYTIAMAMVMYARPDEFQLFKNTIIKHTKNVFC